MIQIEERVIEGIPALELVDSTLAGQPAPLAIFYHGWEGQKERNFLEGYTLAKAGFRTVMPDGFGHGDRLENVTERTLMTAYQVLAHNVEEFPTLRDYYQQQGLIQDDFVAVSGLSLGGMTVGLLVRRYPEISAAVMLEGSPSVAGYIDQILTYVEAHYPNYPELERYQKTRRDADEGLHAADLAEHAETVDGRPFFIWHAADDPVVPVQFDQAFVKAHQEDAFVNTHAVWSAKGGHDVPYHIAYTSAAFLKAAFESKDAAIWEQTKAAAEEKFGASYWTDYQLTIAK